MNWIDDTAQKITDHFFQCGARIKKEDYDTVRTALQEAHTKGAQEALARVEEWVKENQHQTVYETPATYTVDLLHHLQQLKDNKEQTEKHYRCAVGQCEVCQNKKLQQLKDNK